MKRVLFRPQAARDLQECFLSIFAEGEGPG
jgi:hypothetical protein